MPSPFFERARPEVSAGGFPRDDGSLEFYFRVQSLLRPTDVVLDLGAGRGQMAESLTNDLRSDILRIRGKVARFIGADVDPVVLQNPLVDEAQLMVPGQRLPFDDASFDTVICDWVLEHIDDPAGFAAEIGRVLKPGGWFCARTPNKLAYFALAARFIPERLSGKALSIAQGSRQEQDVFPKFYRLNTQGALEAFFPADRWRVHSYMSTPTPAYHGGRLWLLKLLTRYQNIVPDRLKTVILAFVQKREG